MPQLSRRTLWTGTGISLAASAFACALILLQGLPSRSDGARKPAQAAIAVAAPRPASPIDQRFVVKSILPIAGAIKFGEWHWDDKAAPPEGERVITVDLKANVLSIFRDGHEIGATAILTGYGDKPTPLGVFPITEKSKEHVSNLYDAPMPYMLRLTNDGVSIHATRVENGYVTHGCIGVPEAFAAKLFAETRLGDRVIVTDGATMQLGDRII